MNSRRFLDLARELVAGVRAGKSATGGAGEPECRCAIGRAYYAAFLVAREFLNRIGIWVTPTAGGHTAVQFALNNSGAPALVTAARQLSQLASERTDADYEPNNPRTEDILVAGPAVDLAAVTIQMLDIIAAGRATPPVDLAAVADAILAWAKANGQESKIRRL